MRHVWALAGFAVQLPLAAATLTVASTADSGAGSLRQAIMDSNLSVGVADTIAFNIPGAGVHTITPASALPVVTDPVTIDGTTQPGYAGTPLIELDGAGAGAFQTGIDIVAGNTTVRGLAVNRWNLAGIRCQVGGNNVVESNFIGTDPTGTLDLGNGQVGVAVLFGSANNRIGGGTAATRNVISGNNSGLDLQGAGAGNVIRGNFIGTNASGASAIGNGIGIIADSAVVIGGPAPGEGNLISGNNSDGSQLFGADGAVIQGNRIGTDVTGAVNLSNFGNGISLGGLDGVTIGGTSPGAGNVISGNGAFGISINGVTAASILGNLIGADATGSVPLGNGGGGISIAGATAGNAIGGPSPGAGNLIAFNSLSGIFISFATGNAIRGNSIDSNALLGIELLPPNQIGGVSPNDPGDADTGANELQNFPIVSSATPLLPTGAGTRVQGVLHSAASTLFDLDFYANDACSPRPQDFLEGKTYLGSTQVTTDGVGSVAFDVTLPVDILPGQPVSATATDPAGNTSEFSQRLPFSISPPSGPAAGGTPITVLGTDFQTGAAVTIGAAPASDVVVADSATITATSPALPAGTVNDLTVTNPDSSAGILPRAWVAAFLDVPSGHPFYFYVTTLVTNAITVGVGGGFYGVDQSTLRRQMAVFLLKARHGICYTPPPCVPPGIFPDVPCPGTFADWIEALAAEGITGGCGGGNYCPTNPVRRDQMAVFLLKAEHGSAYVPPVCVPPGVFPDVPCPGTFTDWIEQLAAEAITGGCGGGNYCPGNPNTRGQMAVFITKTFNLQ